MYGGGIDADPAVIVKVADADDVVRVVAARARYRPRARRPQRRPQRRRPPHRPTAASSSISRDMKRARDRRRGPDGVGRDRADRRRAHRGARGARPGARLRRHRFGRDRRHHARRRRRLSRPQVRPDHRLACSRPRSSPPTAGCSHVDAEHRARSVLGDPRRRRQLRRRDPLPVPAPRTAGVVGGMLILPATAGHDRRVHRRGGGGAGRAHDDRQRHARPPMPFVPEEHHGELVDLRPHASAPATPAAGERAIAPFRALATPLADLVRPMPLPRDLPARGPRLPPDRRVAHAVHRPRRSRRRATDRRSACGVGRVDPGGAAPGARRRDGARAGRCDRVRPPRRAGSWSTSRRSTTAPDDQAAPRSLGRASSPRRSARTTTAPTSTSSATKARRASGRRIPGPTWDRLARSRPLRPGPTCSTSTRTSRRRLGELDPGRAGVLGQRLERLVGRGRWS